MIELLKYKLYNILSSKACRTLFSLAMVFFLSGCESDDDTSLSEEGNYNEQSSCWQTQITDAVTMIVDQLYKNGCDEVIHGGANLILVAFAVWMAFKLLKVLSSFKEESLGEVWTEIFQKLFICAVCAYFVTESAHVDEALQLFVIPIYQTLIELGLRGISSDGGGEIVHVDLTNFHLGDYGELDFTHDVPVCPDALAVQISDGNLYSSIRPSTNCMVCTIGARLNSGVKIAISLVTSGNIGGILLGIFMICLFTVAKFGFVLFVIDSLFRINFAAFLIPVLILGVPFNFTRKWSKQGFLMFINSSGIMMFMGILINIAMLSLEQLLNQFQNSGDITSENIEGNGVVLLAMFLIALLFVNIPGLAVTLANQFIGGGQGKEFADKITKFAMRMMKKAAAAVINTLSDGATNAFTETMEKYEKTREIMDNAKQIKNAIGSKIDSLAGYNDDD